MYAGIYSKALKAAEQILSLPTQVVAHFPDWLEAMMVRYHSCRAIWDFWDHLLTIISS